MFINPQGLVINDGSLVTRTGAEGPVGSMLQDVHYDPGLMRPYFDRDGKRYVTVNTGKTRWCPERKAEVPIFRKVSIGSLLQRGINSPVFNATVLRKDEWIRFDNAIIRAYRTRLRAWDDLLGSGQVGGFDGMGSLTYEYEMMSEAGEARVDMDGITDGRGDNPLFKLASIPLPITHSDFWFSERRLALSRNRGTPLDTAMAEFAARRVAELVEQTVIGTVTGLSYGTNTSQHEGSSQVYGYTNFPYRTTKTDLNTPTGSNPEAVKQDVIEMRELLRADGFYGPYMLYHSTGYDAFLDDDYFRAGGTSATTTLRDRIKSIEGISDIRRLDFLTSGYVLIMIQMTPDVAQAINAMPITMVQWESQGGLRKNFKVMAIQVPLLRRDYNGNAGIVHATTS